ncbi:MAG: DUF1592 domain-containing protein [Planctomycetota bacterium]
MKLFAAVSAFAFAFALGTVSRGVAQELERDVPLERLGEETRELTEEQDKLRERLRELDRERAFILDEIELVELQQDVTKRLEQLERALLRRSNNEQDLERLQAEAEDAERKLFTLDQLRALRELEREFEEQRWYLRELGFEEADAIAVQLGSIRKQSKRLDDARKSWFQAEKREALRGPPSEADAIRLENQIESHFELIDLLWEWIAAIEAEEASEARQLRRQVKSRLASSPPPNRALRSIQESKLDPVDTIEISETTLARFSHATLTADVVPLLRTFCFECHRREASLGDLDLESLVAAKPLVANRDKWLHVIAHSKNHVMPPTGSVQPTQADREKLVLSLHNLIHRFDYSQVKHPGYEATRRLTHVEYDNTVSDLFGTPVTVAGRFPTELAGQSGFDNSGNTLFLQPTLMERYLTAADEIVETLLPPEPLTGSQVAATESVFFEQAATPEEEIAVARGILERFVSRAYRRPLDPVERRGLGKRYQAAREAGSDHGDAIRAIIRQTLISSHFLLRFEAFPGGTGDHRISDWELASRLSYFLWSSMPDDRLFQSAEQGRLRDPRGLRAEVDRMLVHPRAKSLGSQFAAQWLGSQHVGTRVRLDPIDNPWCTESLMQAMRDETALFFHSLITDNASIRQLVDADYTFLNAELAQHYEMKGVEGQAMQRVTLRDATRGGVLGHGSILAATSFPNRTSPVNRGKWVLDTLLGTPPPPPPPNVSELSEEILENDRLTLRQKLARHRDAPQCNACHREIDPIGLSLERYDWFGRFRSRSQRRPIDDRGRLPDGTEFSGLRGLNQVLLEKRYPDLRRQVATKMLSYALGRQLEYYDEPAVRSILEQIGEENDRFQSLIHQIVQSYPFQFKRVTP